MKYLFLILCILPTAILAQTNSKSTTKPQEESRVTREYDENGNLIKFDSVYVKTWSSGDSVGTEQLKEIQRQIKELKEESFLYDFPSAFINDSTSIFSSDVTKKIEDFFNTRSFNDMQKNIEEYLSPEYFKNIQEFMNKQMEYYMQQSDSVKQGSNDINDRIKNFYDSFIKQQEVK